MFFEGFALEHVAVTDGKMRVRHGGSGPPLLLLHGNPQTHAMWQAVAPRTRKALHRDLPRSARLWRLAEAARHQGSRALRQEGDGEGHGRGDGAFRTHAFSCRQPRSRRAGGASPRNRFSRAQVEKLAVLDIVPTIEHFERADMKFGLSYYHWFWFAQPHPFPEVLINWRAGDLVHGAHLARRSRRTSIHPEALADYLAHARDPEMIRGMCEDYRAAASIDLEHDRASRAAGAEDPMSADGAVGREGPDRPLVRSAGDLAPVLHGRGERQRGQQRPLSRRGGAGGSARALPHVLWVDPVRL